MEYIVTTKIGNFIVRENTDTSKGIKVYTTDNKPAIGSSKVNWWDLDAVTKFIESNESVIMERLGKTLKVA